MKKGLKIALIAVLSLILVAGAGFAVVYATQGDYVRNSFAMLTKDDNEYLQWVAEKNVDESGDVLKALTTTIKNLDLSTTDSTVLVSLSKEFGELIGEEDFPEINKAGVKFGTVSGGKYDIELSLAPVYKDVEILKLASRIDLENKEFFAAIPSYKSDVIDLSELLTTDLSMYFDENVFEALAQIGYTPAEGEAKDAASILKGVTDALYEKLQELEADSEGNKELEESLKQYKDMLEKVKNTFFECIDEVGIEKKKAVTVDDIEVVCNVVSYELTKNGLAKLARALRPEVGELLKQAALRYGEQAGLTKDRIDEELEDILKEYDKAIDDFEKDSTPYGLEGELYVNNRGEVLGGNTRPTFDETRVKVDYLVDVNEDTNDMKMALTFTMNGVKAVTLSAKNSVDAEGYNVSNMEIKPGALITAVLGNKQYVLAIDSRTKQTDADSSNDTTIKLIDRTSGSVDLVTLEVISSAKIGVADFSVDKANGKVIPAKEILDSDYIDAKAIGQMFLNKLKEINDEDINSALSKSMFGSEGGDLYGTLQQLIDSGSLDALTDELKKKILGGNDDDWLVYEESDWSSDEGNSTDSVFGSDSFVFPDDTDASQTTDTPDVGIIQGQVTDNEPLKDNYAVDNMTFEAEKDANGNYVYNFGFLKDVIVSPLEYKGVEVYDFGDDEPDLDTAEIRFIDEQLENSYFDPTEEDTIGFMDQVTFDLVGDADHTYSDITIIIGNYEYDQMLDAVMVGKKPGDEFVITMTLNSKFGDDAGYTGDFTVKIKEFLKWVYPEWTEEYIVGRLGYDSMEECEAYLSEHLDEYAYDNSETLKYQAFFEVQYAAEYKDMPDSMFDRFLAWQDNYYRSITGMSLQEYYGIVSGIYDDSAEDFSIEDLMESYVNDCALYAYIADAENIVVTQQELDAYYNEQASLSYMTVDEAKAKLPEWYAVNYLVEDKVNEVLFKNAVIVEYDN